MDIQRLRYFISVAEHLNFTKAAEEFYIAQPAMSQQIARLEKELNTKLFIRTKRKICLTTPGIIFLEDAKKIVATYDCAIEKLNAIESGYTGILNIAYIGQYERAFLPKIMNQFTQLYPNIHLKLHCCPFESIVQELEQGISDLVFAYPYDLANNPALVVTTLYTDWISAIFNVLHPLAQQSSIDFCDLSDETVIMITENASPENFQRFREGCGYYNFSPKNIEFAPNFDSLLLMVESNMGIAFAPNFLEKSVSNDIKFFPLNKNSHYFTHEIAAVYRKDNVNPCIELFLSICKNYFEKLER